MPPLSPAGQPLASFLDRLGAVLVDGAIMLAVMAVIFVPAFAIYVLVVFPDLLQASAEDPAALEPFGDLILPLLALEAGLLLLMLIGYYVYYVEMMFRSGQTIGKKVMKLRVVPLDPAATLTRGMAARRYLVEMVAGTLIPGFVYLDGLWQLGDKPYLQCLHDKFAGTVVVKVNQ